MKSDMERLKQEILEIQGRMYMLKLQNDYGIKSEFQNLAEYVYTLWHALKKLDYDEFQNLENYVFKVLYPDLLS